MIVSGYMPYRRQHVDTLTSSQTLMAEAIRTTGLAKQRKEVLSTKGRF